MSVSKQNLIGGFTAVAMAASTAFTPSAITAQEISGAQDNSVVTVRAEEPDIIIRYGSGITQDMQSWQRVIEMDGISVEMIADLDVPNCAAIFFRGEEKYRFTDDTIAIGRLSSVAQLLVAGEPISRRVKSDCPITVAELTADAT